MSPKKKESVPHAAKNITDAMATWSFIACFICLFAAWAGWNTLAPTALQFDKYPFILFNLFLSFIAAVQGSVIMIYQKYADAQNIARDIRIDRNSAQIVKMEKEHGKKLEDILQIVKELQSHAK